jgi:hypothetical protein
MSDKEKQSVALKGDIAEQYEFQPNPPTGQGLDEEKLLRKLDLHLLPILILLYLLSFIDRANIVSQPLVKSTKAHSNK